MHLEPMVGLRRPLRTEGLCWVCLQGDIERGDKGREGRKACDRQDVPAAAPSQPTRIAVLPVALLGTSADPPLAPGPHTARRRVCAKADGDGNRTTLIWGALVEKGRWNVGG